MQGRGSGGDRLHVHDRRCQRHAVDPDGDAARAAADLHEHLGVRAVEEQRRRAAEQERRERDRRRRRRGGLADPRPHRERRARVPEGGVEEPAQLEHPRALQAALLGQLGGGDLLRLGLADGVPVGDAADEHEGVRVDAPGHRYTSSQGAWSSVMSTRL
jgi:hypothetical protein